MTVNMEIDNIKTLIEVEKYQSFAKTGKHLFLSSNALKKRIDQLENDLNCQLVIRNSQGVQLTKAGQYFVSEMRKIVTRTDNICQKTVEIGMTKENIFTIGALNTFASEMLVGNWGKNYSYSSETIKSRIVFYDGTQEDKNDMIDSLGKNIDLIVDSQNEIDKEGVLFKKISENKLCFGVAKSNADDIDITFGTKELQLIVPTSGLNKDWDNAVEKVKEMYPNYHIERVNQYDLFAMNDCILNNKAILLIEPWVSVHPYMKLVPLKEDIFINYGLYYFDNNEGLRKLVDEIKKKNV